MTGKLNDKLVKLVVCMDKIEKLKQETIAELHDLEEAWEELEEEFDLDNDATDKPRLYCGRVAGSLDESVDILEDFNPLQFHIEENKTK